MLKPLRPADLKPGDMIDFEPILADPDFAEFAAEHSNLIMVAESELFALDDIERETANTYVLHTDHVSFALRSDYVLSVERSSR